MYLHGLFWFDYTFWFGGRVGRTSSGKNWPRDSLPHQGLSNSLSSHSEHCLSGHLWVDTLTSFTIYCLPHLSSVQVICHLHHFHHLHNLSASFYHHLLFNLCIFMTISLYTTVLIGWYMYSSKGHFHTCIAVFSTKGLPYFIHVMSKLFQLPKFIHVWVIYHVLFLPIVWNI